MKPNRYPSASAWTLRASTGSTAPTIAKRRLARAASLAIAAVLGVASCVDVGDDPQGVEDDSQELEQQTHSMEEDDDCDNWSPMEGLDELCQAAEQGEAVPSLPPENDECAIEVRLQAITVEHGQGASEGDLEVSVQYEVRSDPIEVELIPGLWVTVYDSLDATARVPGSGEETYYPGETKGHDRLLETYVVPVGETKPIQVCAEFTEHDNGGLNGGDDVGRGCVEWTLRCDPVYGQPTVSATIGPVKLCGTNQCNGRMSSDVQVMRADADGDCVPNDDDFTPEPCDEYDKGWEGVGLLRYYHYGDGPMRTLAQAFGTNLDKGFEAYDFVVLLIDEEASNPDIGPFTTNGEAIRKADLVFPPTREGLLDAMQALVSRGYRFDVNVLSHGHPISDDPDDARIETSVGYQISGDWLVAHTQPEDIGTNAGGIPIISWWSTTCWAKRQIDAWIEIGALAASGSRSMNFFPNAFGNYLDHWLNNERYRWSVDQSVTASVQAVVRNFLFYEGALPPWNYGHSPECPLGVMGQNACAEDFFMETGPYDEVAYPIEDIYDVSETGWHNVNVASTRTFLGYDNVTFGYWPPYGWR